MEFETSIRTHWFPSKDLAESIYKCRASKMTTAKKDVRMHSHRKRRTQKAYETNNLGTVVSCCEVFQPKHFARLFMVSAVAAGRSPRLFAMLFFNQIKRITRTSSRSIFNLRKKKDFGVCNAVTIGQVSPERPVPENIRKPAYYFEYMPPGNTIGEVEIKNREQIHRLRASCKLAAKILKECGEIVQVGTTTNDIDAFVHEKIIATNAYPSPLRYAGFPKSVCTSVNNVACHGIPDSRALMDGDIINVDITVYYNGYHGDCSKTFTVGNVDERGRYLVECTEECLMESIKLCHPGLQFNAIGRFIAGYVKKKNLGLIPAFIGHGIGSYFHGPPEILHYKNSMPGVMESGMTFTIEPILTLGGPDVEIQEDGWTAVSVDGARSAQFEHTILVTEKGPEILTITE